MGIILSQPLAHFIEIQCYNIIIMMVLYYTWRRSLFWEVIAIDGECIAIPESVIIATLLAILPSNRSCEVCTSNFIKIKHTDFFVHYYYVQHCTYILPHAVPFKIFTVCIYTCQLVCSGSMHPCEVFHIASSS